MTKVPSPLNPLMWPVQCGLSVVSPMKTPMKYRFETCVKSLKTLDELNLLVSPVNRFRDNGLGISCAGS